MHHSPLTGKQSPAPELFSNICF